MFTFKELKILNDFLKEDEILIVEDYGTYKIIELTTEKEKEKETIHNESVGI